MTQASYFKLPLGECHRSMLMVCQANINSVKGLMPLGIKPLHEMVLSKFLQHHMNSPGAIKLPKREYIDRLMQERGNSIANALELCFSCTNPSICCMLGVRQWDSGRLEPVRTWHYSTATGIAIQTPTNNAKVGIIYILYNLLFHRKTRQIWGIWKLRLAYSLETPNLGQNRWCFVLCDLEIWWMTLENNRASLLCCFKLCATFHSHW